MANREQLAILRRDITKWNKWREADLNLVPELRKAKLRGAELRKANLREAYLTLADLSGADLSEADLSEADLSGADLRKANLNWADLFQANLRGANLFQAILRRANLTLVDLSGARCANANFMQAALIHTKFIRRPDQCPNLRNLGMGPATPACGAAGPDHHARKRAKHDNSR